MPIYNESKQAASFFVLFLITMALYLHSLVLSVVFSAFIQASTTIYERSLSDREETLRLAFASLQGPSGTDSAVQMVETRYIRRTLQILRPHYNAMKVDTLIGIVDSAHRNAIDYNTFRTTVPQALSATVRSAPSRPNLYSYIIESVGAVVAISNFVFVILLSSQGQATWFDGITLPVGFTITMLGFMELLARTNPCVPFRFTPTTKLNFIFDGLAALAVAVSCWGILRREIAVELMLTGRAIDMIRIMRFQRIFRDVIRRSSEVLPALGGPLALVISTHHVLVYIGMSMWGGAITVGTYGDLISPLYDLNNFNSYSEVSAFISRCLQCMQLSMYSLISTVSILGTGDHVPNSHCQRLACHSCCVPPSHQISTPFFRLLLLHFRKLGECKCHAQLSGCILRRCFCGKN